MQRFQTQIQKKSILRRLYTAKITHKLRRAFCYKGAFFSELFGIYYSVIGLVGSSQSGIAVSMSHPVKSSRINYRSAYSCSVTVHIFGSGMSDYISAELYRPAVYGCGKGIVNNERNPVIVGGTGKFFYVKHRECRICDSLTEDSPGLRAECRIQLLLGTVRRNKGCLYAHLGHCYRDEIESAAVYGS